MGWFSPENACKSGECPTCGGQGSIALLGSTDDAFIPCWGCDGTGKVEPVFPVVGSWECSRCGIAREPHDDRACPRCDRDGTAVEVMAGMYPARSEVKDVR